MILTDRIVSHGIASADECEAISAEIKQQVEDSVEFARNSPYPEPGDLFEDMWADPIPAP